MVYTNQQSHDQMIALLQADFGTRLFRANGATYPAIYLDTGPAQIHVDSLLHAYAPTTITTPANYVFYDAQHLETRLASRTMRNDRTYTVARIEKTNHHIQIVGSTAPYFDMVATCDALDHELRDYASGERATMPLREQLFAEVPPEEALLSGAGRAAAIGISVLTVFAMEKRGYHALLVQRSNNLAVGAGLYHIMPAFVFQPFGPPWWNETLWSIEHQILREFGEELFGMPEFHDWPDSVSPDYFKSYAPVAGLIAMLADGRASLTLTGIALNLLSMRPEVCTLLVIHDPSWYKAHKEQLRAEQHTERQATHYIPIETLDGLPDAIHRRMVPHGGVCFWSGLKKFRQQSASITAEED